MQLVVRHIRQLVTVAARGERCKIGAAMRELDTIEDAALTARDGLVAWVGRDADLNSNAAPGDALEIDGSPYVVVPGLVDPHTHLVFAGGRAEEFVLRSQGLSYQDIAQRGGGILSTVRATRQASRETLKQTARRRLDELLRQGVTTVEIKSGYGLDPASEIRMLEVVKELAAEQPVSVVPTFLGAHAVPPEFQGDAEGFVSQVCDLMLPAVGRRGLAAFCDVFCENGYFSVAQARRILIAASRLGLLLKIHADELSSSGGAELAAELNVVSADHLEQASDHGIRRLAEAGVIAVLLPGVSFFLGHGYARARAMIDTGVPVALATDFNPGSCMSYCLPLMMTIACTQMKMTPAEALSACTLNGAAALGLSDRVGSIEPGKQADFVFCDIPDYRYLAYHFGENHAAMVVKRGEIVVS